MQNPWEIDRDDVPDDAGIDRSRRGTKLLTVIAWGSLLAIIGLLIGTDAATLSLSALLPVIGAVITSVALTAVLGRVAYLVMRRLSLISGALFGIGFVCFLLFTFQFVWQLIAEHTNLYSGLYDAVSVRESLLNAIDNVAIDQLFDALNYAIRSL